MPANAYIADLEAALWDSADGRVERAVDELDAVDTVFLSECPASGGTPGRPAVGAVDQTVLPSRLVVERLTCLDEVIRAIKRLEVRGAPAIGVAAALGAYADAWRLAYGPGACGDVAGLLRRFEEDCARLATARPTAVNLAWAVRRMAEKARGLQEQALRAGLADAEARELVVTGLRTEALAVRNGNVRCCRAIGEHGLALLEEQLGGPLDERSEPVGLLTHCNAGRLATVRYGTATAPVYVGLERGVRFAVYCDETRPLLQGARLTALELASAGVDTTLICDNMSASTMRQGLVQAVFVGCDRVAANGDTANKIGTSMVALAARRYGIPFYVCAPTSTIDLATPDGSAIAIEERDAAEVTDLWYRERMAPAGVSVRNPAFDVTDADLISAFVTENGIARPPFSKSLAACAR